MLMVTQRLEGERGRRNGEIERIAHKQKAQKTFTAAQEQRELAKIAAKQFLSGFKRDNLAFLQQIGLLRDRFEHNLNADLLPALYAQVKEDFHGHDKRQEEFDEMVKNCATKLASEHQKAIKDEMLRRQRLK